MKEKFLVGLLTLFLVGCAMNSRQQLPQVDVNRKPLTIKDMAKIVSYSSTDLIIKTIGLPQSVSSGEYCSYWYYPLSDNQLKQDTTIEISVYGPESAILATDFKELPYKQKDLLRERFYFYYVKKAEAEDEAFEASLNNIRAIGDEQKEQYFEEKTRDLEKKVDDYQEKLMKLKEKLIEERGKLPAWYIEN
jgi:hypothetical protein